MGKTVVEDNRYVKLMKHCIGLDHKKPYKRHGKLFYRPYRNYYGASPQCCTDWDLIVDAGYAEAGKETKRGGRVYWLNRAGLDFLGSRLGIYIWDEED